MRRFLVVLCLSMAMGFQGFAQGDGENLPNVIKINPIGLAFGNFNLAYQRALSNSSAIQIGANYWYRIFGANVSGIGTRAGYQFFLTSRTKSAPEGFYIGPQVSFNSINEKETDVSLTAFGVGVMLGYQWVWDSGLCLDLGIGPMYQFASESDTNTSYEGFLPNVTIALGFNF
ncbi:MAG: DUF3575 domain-containing protein [Cyclobacteriaceae bacterium]|nr:DUF3575 domain-containing protein [Cyclobacteriaceae bacterium]